MSSPLPRLDLGRGGRDLLVLLPGAAMRPEEFASAGFAERAALYQPGLDLCVVGLDLARITGADPLPALTDEILGPARRQYRQVWLGGISLGGLLALAQAASAPDSIDGLCLLAPYPGSRPTWLAIERAGGLAAWQASAEQLSDPEFRVWHWLQQPPSLPAFVGWGSADRFAAGMARLAGRFPESARQVRPGAHDWPTWQALWDDFLARDFFA